MLNFFFKWVEIFGVVPTVTICFPVGELLAFALLCRMIAGDGQVPPHLCMLGLGSGVTKLML